MLHKELNQEVKTKASDQHPDLEAEVEAELAEVEVIPKDPCHTTKYKDKICDHKTLSNQWALVTLEEQDRLVHQLIIHKAQNQIFNLISNSINNIKMWILANKEQACKIFHLDPTLELEDQDRISLSIRTHKQVIQKRKLKLPMEWLITFWERELLLRVLLPESVKVYRISISIKELRSFLLVKMSWLSKLLLNSIQLKQLWLLPI